MSVKFTIDSIKDLKMQVKESDNILSIYTQNQFIPDDSFRLILITEGSEIQNISQELVPNMIEAFNRNNGNEFEAGKFLYENLNLSPKQASDIGFWTYHNHYTFYPYISKRWSDLWKGELSSPSTYIINHWIQSNSSQGELIDYPISGLWWAFYLTIDEDNENDKYWLTEVFFKNLSIRTKLLGTARFARHKPAILGILEFILENNLENSLEQAGRAIVPYINLLGGIRPLAYFQKNWFKDKLNTQFGEKISNGESLFVRPDKNRTGNRNQVINHYFHLDSGNGEYLISTNENDNGDYHIALDFTVDNQFLIHFYKEGNIKKSNINNTLRNINVDQTYGDGKCQYLTLSDIQLINEPKLFGIAYKTDEGTFFKAIDAQNKVYFNIENAALNEKGTTILYLNTQFQSAYKILPYDINRLARLIKSPLERGYNITDPYFNAEWERLEFYWPELFNEDADIWN